MSTMAAAPVAVPGLRRNMVTICAMTATIMQALDTTIDTRHHRSLAALLGLQPAAANQDQD